jgi:hypothetical protein
MATAKMHGDQAIVAYVNGKAVDSEGAPIQGAPKQPADTDPSQQPGAPGSPSSNPIEQLAQVLAGKLGGAGTSSQSAENVEVEIPTLAVLPDVLAAMGTVEQVKALQAQDERKGAQKLYEDRIAELEA